MSFKIDNEVMVLWQVEQDINMYHYMSSTACIVGKTILIQIYLVKLYRKTKQIIEY